MVEVRKRNGSLFGEVSDAHAVDLQEKGWVTPVRSPAGKLRFVALSEAAEVRLATADAKVHATGTHCTRAYGIGSCTVTFDGDRRSQRNYRHINAKCFRWRLAEARDSSLRKG